MSTLVIFPPPLPPCGLRKPSRNCRNARTRMRLLRNGGAHRQFGSPVFVRCLENGTGVTEESSPSPPTTREGEEREESSSGQLPELSNFNVGSTAFAPGDFSLLQTRRFWLGTTVGLLAALQGNLAGITSSIFDLNPEVWKGFRADLVYPVEGFKRCLDTSRGFELR